MAPYSEDCSHFCGRSYVFFKMQDARFCEAHLQSQLSGRLRQEDHKLKANLSYRTRLSQKEKL